MIMAETIDVTPSQSSAESTRDVSGSMTVTHVLYALHALAPFTFWILAVVAMIVGMIKRDDVRGTWVDTHYSWLSRTFWWGILWAIAAWTVFWLGTFITLGLGAFVLWILPLAVLIWYLYRVIKGWLRLNDLKGID